jgi:autotransporter-associated beta strand protein
LGGDWSVGANWTGGTGTGGIPGTADDVTFGDAVLTGNGTTMDENFTIDSLSYSPDNGVQQTTTINQGLTLQISDAGSGNVLFVGNTDASITASTQVNATILGAGTLSTLTLNGSGNLLVCQGDSTSGSHMSTLNLQGVATLNATLGGILVGTSTQSGPPNRPSGTLLLAQTSFITLTGSGTGSASALEVQYSEVNANGSTLSLLELGQVTDLNVNSIEIGGAKGDGTMEFNSSFSSPTLQLRNSDGVSPVSLFQIGDDSYVSSGNSSVGVADFSLGSVDALVATVYLGHGNPGTGTGSSTGTLNLGAGTFAVTTTMIVGYQIATVENGAATGTVNVENNGIFPSGATLSVAGPLVLAQINHLTSTPVGAVAGTVTVNSGATLAADSIVAGGGNSALSVNGTLWLTNTAGTLAQPLGIFNPGGAALNFPASNAGAAINASNLIASSISTINITSVPGIASYPATFTLITYQTGDTSGGNFVLGTLPAGSPTYQGTILDTGNGVVQLKLTQGPIADLSLLWTGADNNNWDTSTGNWLYQGSPSSFFVGGACLFNDTSSVTNVSLAESLTPSSVTVNNTNDLYTFEGAGNIAGASLLAKEGSGTLILDNSGVDNFQAVTMTGTLQLGNGDTNGALAALTIADNGALVDLSTAALDLTANISGSGFLTVTNGGGGSLTLSGSNSYSGPTTLTGGSLIINGLSTGTGAITTAAGTVLAGSGIVNGAVTVAGELNPGPLGGTGGVFTASNGLTLSTGATLSFGLSPTDTSSVGSATIAVTGNLAVHNNQITVNFSGPPQQNTYPVMTYTGTLSGAFNPVILGTHYAATVDTTSTPNTVNVVITGSSGVNLVWASQSSTAWDSLTENWTNIVTEQPSLFFAGDNVLLDDTAGVQTTITLAAGVTVAPTDLTNNSDNNSFTISGAGSITGPANIVKTGTSILTLDTANTFTGSVDIQQGVLMTANGLSVASSSGVTAENGATLDVDGQNLSPAVISASGVGDGGSGAIYNSGGANNNNFRELNLLGDITLGGSGMWEINNSGGTASISSGGNPYSITKVGNNNITFANISTFDAAISNIDIQAGELEFSGLTSDMGNPLATNIVESGGELAFENGTVTWNKNFLFNGNGSSPTVEVDGGGYPTLNGNVQLSSGGCVFNVTGLAMQIIGPISGPGDLIKEGAAPLALEGTNTYTGDTTITTGTLLLETNGSIADTAVIDIDSGTTLDVSQRLDSTLTLATGQTLEGTGTLNGSLIAGAGSIVSPGQSSVGTLTVTNTVVLSGLTSMGLDQAGATNSVLASHSTITYGGVLDLNELTGPLATGSSFKLFRATSYLGSFSSLNPATPGAGQTWDTSALGTSGTIRVAAPAPRFGSITLAGTNLVISGSDGRAAGDYYVLTSTNVALPLTNWTRIATNVFDGSGDFSFTNSVSPSVPSRFFLLELP